MPNFWSKAGQYISEKLSGSRTNDEEITKSCETMKNMEKGLLSLKLVLQNFLSYFENFSKYFTDINSAIKLIYQDSPFNNFTEEITCKHEIIQSELSEMNKKMNIILLKTSEWNIIFKAAKEQIKIREEKRKVYDHYESKLAKINKTNNNNNQKKDVKFIERNESKFSKAASEYVEISEKAFNTINTSLKMAWELANPIIDEIITNEKIFFENMSQSLSWFKNNNERFLEMKNNINNPNINKDTLYDPMKYMGEKDLMVKISMNRNHSPYLFPQKLTISNLLGVGVDSTKRKSNVGLGTNNNRNNLTKYCGIENYSNIYIKSRITNSFGEINTKKLNEFYTIIDDF